jgi:hypothetical protein
MSKKNEKKIIEKLKVLKPTVYADIKPNDRNFKKLFFKTQKPK